MVQLPFIPACGGPGGDDPRSLELGLFRWQVGEPFVEELFAERSCSIQSGNERGWAVPGEQVGRIAALRESGVSRGRGDRG